MSVDGHRLVAWLVLRKGGGILVSFVPVHLSRCHEGLIIRRSGLTVFFNRIRDIAVFVGKRYVHLQKELFYIAHYPVRWTAQSALLFIPTQTRLL